MKHLPQRTCVACRNVKVHDEMLRIASQDGALPQLDAGKHKASGRGAYLCRDLNCARNAWKKRAFERALKLKAPLDAAIKEQVEAAISTPINSQERQHMN